MNAHATPHASGTVFLDVFVEHASALPARVHKHLRMVRELDECAADLSRRVSAAFPSAHNGPDAVWEEARTATTLNLELADAKVALAMQTYDLIDNHIRRLDQDLKCFEAELKAAGIDNPPVAGTASHNLTSSQVRRADHTPHVTTDMELPIDPNEPVYCMCRQVAFGQMIACDDPECVFEWFHYQCVGLTPSTRPKATNEWFCPDCTARHRLA